MRTSSIGEDDIQRADTHQQGQAGDLKPLAYSLRPRAVMPQVGQPTRAEALRSRLRSPRQAPALSVLCSPQLLKPLAEVRISAAACPLSASATPRFFEVPRLRLLVHGLLGTAAAPSLPLRTCTCTHSYEPHELGMAWNVVGVMTVFLAY